jgi:hypothetical protein
MLSYVCVPEIFNRLYNEYFIKHMEEEKIVIVGGATAVV